MKINKSISIIIIGFGSIGRRHYNNLLKLGYDNIVVFDINDKIFFGGKKIKRVKELDEKSLKNFKVAFICSPSNIHLKHAIMCAKAGCQIFIEKPLAHDLKNINKLVNIIEKNKTINMVACNMRFHPCLIFIKKYLDRNKIGNIYSIQHEFGYYLPAWRPQNDYTKGYAAERKSGGGIILDDIHEFDLLFWFNNFEKVIENKFIFDKVSSLDINTEDFCLASFKFKNKVIGLVRCDYLQKKYNRTCKVIGEYGNLRWDFNENIVWLETKSGDKKIFEVKNWDINNMYIEEVRYFLKCLNKEERAFNDVNVALKILKYCVERK
jgi:predicted dehydrogenase